MKDSINIESDRFFGLFKRFVQLLCVCQLFVQPLGAEDHRNRGNGANRPNFSGQGARRAPCSVSPRSLANFANGEGRRDYGTLVRFVSHPSCRDVASIISHKAVRLGVSFHDKAPFRLDMYAKGTQKNDGEARDRAGARLEKRFATLLRQYPQGADTSARLTAQASLLSLGAGRAGLVYLAQQQLLTADALTKENKDRSGDVFSRVARAMLRLGMNRGPIASEFARSVEEMAMLSQADSLGKIFRSLGSAAAANSALIPTFNLSAGAVRDGILKGESSYTPAVRTAMLQAIYSGVQSANEGNELFQPAMLQLNDALFPLMKQKSLKETALKGAWNKVLLLLSENASQTALAEAVALSLTPEIIFLAPEQRSALLLAGRNYHGLAVALQDKFLEAHNKLWSNYEKENLKKDRYIYLRKRFIKPWVSETLDLGPARLTRRWLQEVVRAGLIRDEDVEQKFPLFVLAHLQRGDRASLGAIKQSGVEPTMASMAESFAVLWSLSRIHVPVLMKWVEQYDSN